MAPSCQSDETAIELVPVKIRAAVAHEMDRREEEVSDYLEIVSGFGDDGKPYPPLGEEVSAAVVAAVKAVLDRRLVGGCERYLRLLVGRRATENHEKFGIAVLELVRERLDDAEDIVPFEEVDWARMRGILTPEDVGAKTWRKLSEEGWQMWRTILRSILPEVYGERPMDSEPSTGAVQRTPQRVEALARRYAAGLGLYHPDDQLHPGVGEALEPLSVAGNGRKAPSTRDGIPVEYRLVKRGERRGKDVVREQDGLPAEWRAPCLDVLRPVEITSPEEIPTTGSLFGG